MEIKNLSYAYTKGHLILNKLNLKVTPGAITTLMGANGSGKSTLLKIMSRQMKPSRGRVLCTEKIFSPIRRKTTPVSWGSCINKIASSAI